MLSTANFSLWAPVMTFEKAGVATDYSNMRLKGIASTISRDLDGEVLKADGFDISYLLTKGFINWHHQAKLYPSCIIGEPETAEITNKGLYVEARLYDTPIAREAYDLAKVLQAQSKRRRLGWSIEGQVKKREDGGTIAKAVVTGIALTHAPKNATTFAEVMKAFDDVSIASKLLTESPLAQEDWDLVIQTKGGSYYIRGEQVDFVAKAMETEVPSGSAGSGRALMVESLEGGHKLKKQPDLLKRILQKYPHLTFEKATKLYENVLKNNN